MSDNPQLKDKLKPIFNWGIFSTHRTYLMGVAIICIMIFHTPDFVGGALIPGVVDFITRSLNIGVEMFLFLSGVGLYFSYSKKPKFTEYYTKRILNVYVPTLAMVIPHCLYYIFLKDADVIKTFLSWTGISFWYQKGSGLIWYVVMIMVMYLIYPLLCKIIFFKDNYWYQLISTFLLCAVSAGSTFLLYKLQNDVYEMYEIFLTRIPIFIIGTYCGKLVYDKKDFGIEAYTFLIGGIIIKAIWPYPGAGIISRFSMTPFCITFMFAIVLVISFVKIKPLHKFVSYLGTMTLELYIIHNIYRGIVGELLEGTWLYETIYGKAVVYYVFLCICIPISILFAKGRVLVVGKYTERLKLKKQNTKDEK